MRLYNGKPILCGLAFFIAVVTFPLWRDMGCAVPVPQPGTDTPVIREMTGKRCILPTSEMRTGHMQLLNEWRTVAVQNGSRSQETVEGKTYAVSLRNGCMNCHSNKTQFCDRCHSYAGMQTDSAPYCWTCHIAPREDG